MMPLNLRAPILPPDAIELPVTVRRMRGGGLMLFVGNNPIKGIAGISIGDDGEHSMMTVMFNCQDIYFDTEPVKADPKDQANN